MDDHRKSERPVVTPEARRGFLDRFLTGEDEESQEQAAEATAEQTVQDRVIEALRKIYDPEIPVNIYDLGLIYGCEVDGEDNVAITMTLTSPHCPVAESLPAEVELRARDVPGVGDVTLDLVWDPPWGPDRMTDEAKLELGLL